MFLYWGWGINISRKIITFENLCPPALRVKVIRAELLIDIPVKEDEVKTHKKTATAETQFFAYINLFTADRENLIIHSNVKKEIRVQTQISYFIYNNLQCIRIRCEFSLIFPNVCRVSPCLYLLFL